MIVCMSSGCGVVEETLDKLVPEGEKVGLVNVRLYRPFDSEAFLRSLPQTVKTIAVLDRTKEPGAAGEPLYQDVLTALAEHWADVAGGKPMPRVIAGRYGLSSKEFTPAMAYAVFRNWRRQAAAAYRRHQRRRDQASLVYDRTFSTERPA